MRPRFPVVFFDLDGTLLRGTTVSLLTAEWLGRRGELDELEQRYAEGAISNAVIAERSAPWFAGRSPAEVERSLAAGPWIDGVGETVERCTPRACTSCSPPSPCAPRRRSWRPASASTIA